MKIFCFKAPKFLSFFLKPFVKKQEEEEKKEKESQIKLQEEIKTEPTNNVYEDGTSDDAFFDDFFADD